MQSSTGVPDMFMGDMHDAKAVSRPSFSLPMFARVLFVPSSTHLGAGLRGGVVGGRVRLDPQQLRHAGGDGGRRGSARVDVVGVHARRIVGVEQVDVGRRREVRVHRQAEQAAVVVVVDPVARCR